MRVVKRSACNFTVGSVSAQHELSNIQRWRELRLKRDYAKHGCINITYITNKAAFLKVLFVNCTAVNCFPTLWYILDISIYILLTYLLIRYIYYKLSSDPAQPGNYFRTFISTRNPIGVRGRKQTTCALSGRKNKYFKNRPDYKIPARFKLRAEP